LELSGKKAMCCKSIFNRSRVVPTQQRKLLVSVICACLTVIAAAGQDMFSEDTITIRAVTITAPQSIRHIPFSIAAVDSSSISFFRYDDLGDLLEAATPFSIKQNGNSGLASVAIRGMSGSHILVLWNGISITGSNTGMADLALIPVSAASSVMVTAGGADLEEITGSVGGKIELISVPSGSAGTEVSLTTLAGSFDEYASFLSVKTGTKRISAKMSIWGRNAQNDFLFLNTNDPGGPVRLSRNNAASSSAGIMNDLFFTRDNSLLSFHFWYNTAARELPGPVTTVEQNFGEKQDDRSVRGVVHYKNTAGKITADLTAGFTSDVNIYNNESADIRGENRNAAFTLRAGIRLKLEDNLELGASFGNEFQTVNSLSYLERKERNLFSTTLTAVYNPGRRVRMTLQAREIIMTSDFITPEFTAGASYLLSGDGSSVVKGNVSRNVKLPTMNDLYWNPGGTDNLDPEISTGAELGYSYNSVKMTGGRNTFDLTLHASEVKDLIQWVPGNYGYWSATNIRDVKVSGFETRIARKMPVTRGMITAAINYSLTGSTVASSGILNDRTVGKQLIYMPLHHLSANVSANYAFLNGGLTLVSDSRRYITADNSQWLPGNCTVNAEIGADLHMKSTVVKIGAAVENLLNSSWESVKNYPMPLRSYRIKLTVTINSNVKK
jgi:iron complex outermembrane receptor protein